MIEKEQTYVNVNLTFPVNAKNSLFWKHMRKLPEGEYQEAMKEINLITHYVVQVTIDKYTFDERIFGNRKAAEQFISLLGNLFIDPIRYIEYYRATVPEYAIHKILDKFILPVTFNMIQLKEK